MLITVGLFLATQVAWADSLWQRRDGSAYLFQDYRARKVGDLLTLVVSESTEFEGLERRELNKETKTGLGTAWKVGTAGDWGINKALGELDAAATSNRKFDSRNNSTIDRRFLDRMTVTVIDVLPNGNLVVEGSRVRTMSREMRSLKVSGIVRPADIGPFNTVQSQSIANFNVTYEGRGPESRTTNRNWLGRAFDIIWPF